MKNFNYNIQFMKNKLENLKTQTNLSNWLDWHDGLSSIPYNKKSLLFKSYKKKTKIQFSRLFLLYHKTLY